MPVIVDTAQSLEAAKKATGSPLCCHKCFRLHNLAPMFMLVCPICGNKRCPHASDHELACTGSNASDQPGSIYSTQKGTP